MRLDEITYSQAASYREVIIPIGSVEQHGRALPLGTDSIIADEVGRRLASRKGMLVCPTIFFGFSTEHSSFPGTIDLGLDAFLSLVERVVMSLQRDFELLYLVNFHGGNSAALESLVKKINSRRVHLIHFWRAAGPVMERVTDQGEIGIEHAGEFETSLMQYLRPELVAEEISDTADRSVSIGGRTHIRSWHTEEFTEDGSFGGARLASKGKGEVLCSETLDRMEEIIDDIRNEFRPERA